MSEQEEKAHDNLIKAWREVYDAREMLGSEHEEYREIDKIVDSLFLIYRRLENKKAPQDGNLEKANS